MVKPTPDNVKEVLSQLTSSQQVVLRAYIASLKEEIKEAETALRQAEDGDPHAHYHGHEKCTSDHSHGHEHHGKEEVHKDHDHAHEHHAENEGHSHGHEHNADKEEHSHGHDHQTEKEGHSHGHEHHAEKEGHSHGHEHQKDDDVPAWKKKALEAGASADPMAAPFGGSWNTEAVVSAKDDDKMEE